MQINTKLNIGLCTLSTILDKNGLGLFMVRAGCCKVYQGCRAGTYRDMGTGLQMK